MESSAARCTPLRRGEARKGYKTGINNKTQSAFILQILATDAKTVSNRAFALMGGSQFKLNKRGLKIRLSCYTFVMLMLSHGTAEQPACVSCQGAGNTSTAELSLLLKASQPPPCTSCSLVVSLELDLDLVRIVSSYLCILKQVVLLCSTPGLYGEREALTSVEDFN